MQCFKIYLTDIEERLDCNFYKPEYLKIEKKVKTLTNKTLGEYIISISSGATPEKDTSDKFYVDSSKLAGVPFLRVQNITEDGINLQDCKYINYETHNGMLKRSQVKEDDLIVTITGRIASSTVAPKGFNGNINQHSVVIKTKESSISKTLATFLNSSIGQKLALRRTSGGTRPALDYGALKTIPIIYRPEIVELMETAYKNKKQNEEEAKKLLSSIDSFILDKLGISLPKIETKKCYKIYSKDLEHNRLDTDYNDPKYKKIHEAFTNSNFTVCTIADISEEVFQGIGKDEVKHSKYILLKVKNIYKNNTINYEDIEYIKDIPQNKILKKGDIVAPFIGEAVKQIKFSLFDKDNEDNKYTVDNNTGVIRLKNALAQSLFITLILNSIIGKIQVLQLLGGGGVPFLGALNVKKIKIILPSIEIQNRIAEEYQNLINKATQLQKEAKKSFEQTKARVERIILGEEQL